MKWLQENCITHSTVYLWILCCNVTPPENINFLKDKYSSCYFTSLSLLLNMNSILLSSRRLRNGVYVERLTAGILHCDLLNYCLTKQRQRFVWIHRPSGSMMDQRCQSNKSEKARKFGKKWYIKQAENLWKC